MEDKKSPCTPDTQADLHRDSHPPIETSFHARFAPLPRTFEGEEYYGAADVAKILGVAKRTVLAWNSTTLNGCPLFTADKRTHDNTFLYKIERVEQLASVYHPDWKRGGYQTSPTCTGQEAIISFKLTNLPEELLKQPRFFELYGKEKSDTPKAWSNPDNQIFCTDIKQGKLAGFDTCGHDRAADYLLVDFDHVLDDNGQFVNADAEHWFKTLSAYATYCEISQSGHGIHFLFRLTAGKFSMVSGGKRGTLHFGDDAKLELFYLAKARYCLLTGNIYHCEPNTPIVAGELADDAMQKILDEIERRNVPEQPARKSESLGFVATNGDYDSFRASIMLDTIEPAELEDTDWLAVISACKNIGIPYVVVDAWNKRDPDRYNAEENLSRWNSISDPSFGIETLHGIAKRFNYSEKDTRRQWYDLHPDFARKHADRADVYSSPAPMDGDQTTDDGEITTKYYVKDCPVALTIPANFEFKNRGITQLVPDKKKPDEPKRVITTRTPIIPTKILREAKSGTVQYEIAIKSGDTWRKAIVSGRTINDSRAIIDLADYGALVEYPAALKSFFNSIIATNLTNGRLTSSKVYKMPGWHDGEFIYPQSTGDKIVMRDGIDYDSLFAVKGSRNTWYAKFEETCFNKGLPNSFGTNILLAQYIVGNALLAPALEILGLPNTQVHLWGARNSAKSPILKLAVSIYGNPTEGKLFRNFASTAKNRMTFAAGLCDLPLAIDELEAADKFDDLQGETYRFFGGTINQANKRDGRTREAEDFRGVRLMTGEHAFIEVDTAKGGAIKRVIQIQAKTPLMPEKRAHELHLFLADNFGHYGREWTKYLAEHKRELKEAFAVLKDKIANDDATPNCEATHIRAVLGAFFCFAIFNKIFGTNYVTTDDEWILLHTRLILRELPTLDEIDVAKRAIDYLSSYVDEHPRKFLTDSATYESQDEQKRKSEELDGIKYHDGKVAFFANAFKRVISKSGLPSYSAVLSELYEADALIAKNSREKSCRVYHPITQTRARVYLFKEKILSISAKDYESEDDLP